MNAVVAPGSRIVPEFDVALWGYDRQQVERCLTDLTGRLEAALGQLDSVAVLHEQLCEARLEADQLREEMRRRPSWGNRLAMIMERAEKLRREAEQAAQLARGNGRGDRRRRRAGGS